MTVLPIHLPVGFIPRVKQGDIVASGDILAECSLQQEVVSHIADQLGLSFAKTRKILKKIPGDKVVTGDILAQRTGLFGFSKAEVISNVSGIVTRYERHTGKLVIRTDFSNKPQQLSSPVAGTVALCDNKKIVINAARHILQGEKGIGETTEGEVLFLDKSFSESDYDNLLYYLDSNAIGKVIVGGFFTREMLLKSVGLGAKGIIAIQIAEDDLSYFTSRGRQMPVVIVKKEDCDLLKQWQGKKIFLDGNSRSIVFLQT